jgi:hypothetical protein
MSTAAAGGTQGPDLETRAASGAAGHRHFGTAGHRHFGYWIDRDWGRARCYGCGFQFAGTDETAED